MKVAWEDMHIASVQNAQYGEDVYTKVIYLVTCLFLFPVASGLPFVQVVVKVKNKAWLQRFDGRRPTPILYWP